MLPYYIAERSLLTGQGNSIEYEYLLGEPLREGKRLGVAMPVLSTLYALCSAIQWRTKEERNN
jgi:ketopantoate reductase